MVACLLEGMQRNAHTQVNYDKIREITQGAEGNPTLFMACLMDALLNEFISQSTPNIRKKLHQLEQGTETLQQELLNMAF
jgi:hypothetical protein